MVRAGVKFYRRLLPILLALVVALALMVSVSVPAYAVSYTIPVFDSFTQIGSKVRHYSHSAGEWDLNGNPDFRVSRVQGTDRLALYLLKTTEFDYPVFAGDYFVFDGRFNFPDVSLIPSGDGYFRFTAKLLYYNDNLELDNFDEYDNNVSLTMHSSVSDTASGSSEVIYHNINLDNFVLEDNIYVFTFVLPLEAFQDLISVNFELCFELKTLYPDDVAFYWALYFDPFTIEEVSYDEYLQYIEGQLSSILTEEQKQSGYLEQLVSLVTSGNAKLDQIISIIQTVNSSNATVAEKIEAGNQLQQIQNNLIQGDVNATTPDVIVDADVQAGDLSSAEDAIYSELGEIDFSIFDPDIMFSPVVPGFAFAGLIYKKIFDIPIVYTITFAALILGLACAIIGRTVGRD